MRILHAMLSDQLGGIEYAFARYTKALQSLGHVVTCVTAPGALIRPHLYANVRPLAQRFQWDPKAVFTAFKMTRGQDIIVTHGNRASRLFALANFNSLPQAHVLHRPRFKGLTRYDRVICVTKSLQEAALALGAKAEYVPNFITNTLPMRPLTEVKTIGFLGRFVPEKGADLLVEALALLQQRGIAFEAILGGEGEERSSIEALLDKHRLRDRVTLPGWVEDANTFYPRIDVLCMPSRSESFGLTILEAWQRGVPVVSTHTSGPSELITHESNGLLCAMSAEAIADMLARVLGNLDFATRLIAGGTAELRHYTMDAVAPKLQDALPLPL